MPFKLEDIECSCKSARHSNSDVTHMAKLIRVWWQLRVPTVAFEAEYLGSRTREVVCN